MAITPRAGAGQNHYDLDSQGDVEGIFSIDPAL